MGACPLPPPLQLSAKRSSFGRLLSGARRGGRAGPSNFQRSLSLGENNLTSARSYTSAGKPNHKPSGEPF